MCVSLAAAMFSATVICLSEAIDPVTGRRVVVLIYANTAQNLSDGPNAMWLHIPTRALDERQVIDTALFPSLAKDLIEAVKPPQEMRSLGEHPIRRGGATVFDKGMYTLVTAHSARDVPGALNRVAEDRRPRLDDKMRALCAGYDQLFSEGYMHVLCCFAGRKAFTPDPVMLFYEPADPAHVMLPALDAHDGRAPVPGHDVDVDHWVILGSQEQRISHMRPTFFREHNKMPADVRALLPKYVMGRQFLPGTKMPNGDFVGPRKALHEGPGYLQRGLLPPA